MGDRLDLASLSRIEFIIRWQSAEARHREHYLARRANIWRDMFPPGMRDGLIGLTPGESFKKTYPAGEALPARDPGKVVGFKRGSLQPWKFRGGAVEPRYGRFYPRGLLSDLPGIYPQDRRPFRVVGLEADDLLLDMNQPLAGRDFEMEARVLDVARKSSETGGSLNSWLELTALNGPGMQARVDGRSSDFGEEPLQRSDDSADREFYDRPRIIGHVDAQASALLRDEYAVRMEPGSRILDLMAGRQSHLPEEFNGLVLGLGMNSEEMDANPALFGHLVHDLNQWPELPLGNAAFDAIICSLSVEYLIRPWMVVQEAARVLKPGGKLLVSFSDRWFPTKACGAWAEMHAFERAGFVLDLMLDSGSFRDLETVSYRNWWRPADDRHIGQTRTSDPVFLVQGSRAER